MGNLPIRTLVAISQALAVETTIVFSPSAMVAAAVGDNSLTRVIAHISALVSRSTLTGGDLCTKDHSHHPLPKVATLLPAKDPKRNPE